MSFRILSMWWNACLHRLDVGLYFHLKEFTGMESEPMLTPRKKSPLLEAQRRVKPATLHLAGQRAQHTTNWAIPIPMSLSSLSPRYDSTGHYREWYVLSYTPEVEEQQVSVITTVQFWTGARKGNKAIGWCMVQRLAHMLSEPVTNARVPVPVSVRAGIFRL